ncbi:hypothetical protein [Glycomyces tritici]|uniref:Uncharacterized protein n=1 Tax=Glycomyces tritici TaxID=2665176 RepID=A0ABT7YX53_9ACTN|nr:hypothetical protein [Glycomyces tritici]MDN3243167.1 hypothetical protein [Glycomyces tritici]
MTDRMASMHLVNRPNEFPSTDGVVFTDVPLPEPVPCTALVENLYLSVYPHIGQLMDEGWELLRGRETILDFDPGG